MAIEDRITRGTMPRGLDRRVRNLDFEISLCGAFVKNSRNPLVGLNHVSLICRTTIVRSLRALFAIFARHAKSIATEAGR